MRFKSETGKEITLYLEEIQSLPFLKLKKCMKMA